MTPKVSETPSSTEAPDNEKIGATGEFQVSGTINYDLIQTEDGIPVENNVIAQQMRLLTEPLYASWAGPGEGRTFKVYSNVGLFFDPKQPGLCPDVMISLDVPVNLDLSQKQSRSYFLWDLRKPPEVVIEIVSYVRGGEDSVKLLAYARLGIPCYVIYDPDEYHEEGVLRAFRLTDGDYQKTTWNWFPEAFLGLTLWQGSYENQEFTWLRWCDQQGKVIATGAERAMQQQQQADLAKQQADLAKQETVLAKQQADRMAAKLRELGIDPGV